MFKVVYRPECLFGAFLFLKKIFYKKYKNDSKFTIFVLSIKNKFFMVKKVKEMIKLIEKDGWYLKSHKASSHRQYMHDTKKGKVTINGKPSDDLNDDLIKSILKQAGLK